MHYACNNSIKDIFNNWGSRNTTKTTLLNYGTYFFKQGRKREVLGTCRSCVWLSHITQLMKEAGLDLSEEACQSVRTKNQNEQKWKSVQEMAGAGWSTGAGDSTAALWTLFSTDSPEEKKQTKLTSSSSIVKLKQVEFELCCTRIEVEWRTFCFYACTEI